MQHPKISHRESTLRIVRYIKKYPRHGILLKKDVGSPKLTGYYDLDWASCLNTRRSVTGYIVKLGDSLISWKSKKQQTISRSSTQVEYMSLAALFAELVWKTGLLKELNFPVSIPILVFTNSTNSKLAIQITENSVFQTHRDSLSFHSSKGEI